MKSNKKAVFQKLFELFTFRHNIFSQNFLIFSDYKNNAVYFCIKTLGAPERSRTSNLQIRSLMLYPIELQALKTSGGERGIRTLASAFIQTLA